MAYVINMYGNSTGYGDSSGDEIFNMSNYSNTALLAGANDTVNVLGGGDDTVDLNSTGFNTPVTDVISLGATGGDRIEASHVLYNANITITGTGGPTAISLVNHGGSTSIALGTAAGAIGGLNAPLVLNGDATNSVSYAYGGGAVVGIGAAGDGLFGYESSVALAGIQNLVTGGDENFTVTNASGLNTVTLGNGVDAVSLGGNGNVVSLGNGNDQLAFTGTHNSATLGTGNDQVAVGGSFTSVAFAAGGAGSTDSVTLRGAHDIVTGGDENVTITGGKGGAGYITLGNGTDTLNLLGGGGHIMLGSKDLTNTADDQVTIGKGNTGLVLNAGQDQVVLGDQGALGGGDKVILNATLLGTSITAAGAFDTITLTHDANLALTDASQNGGLLLTVDADSAGGMGDISISGLSGDRLAHIHLVGASAYTVTTDDTPQGGVTFHFAQGSIDLIGMQSVPNNLFT